ncbi:MAG: pyruvate kinase [Alphaproteobacteria bacterium]|nr:pyruvate kinase [Alphaproteobacteria bacterium]
MRRNRNVKVLATLGPTSSNDQTIRQLFEFGADVFRLNMSHGTHEDVESIHKAIRSVELDLGRPVGILADLQGPKLRIGVMEGEVVIEKGNDFQLVLSNITGNMKGATLPHKEVFEVLKPGMLLLLDDGKIRLKVVSVKTDVINTLVMVGGVLSSNKGVNVPDAILPLSSLTIKDKKDLEFCLGLGVDWVALSFVQRATDIIETKKIIGDRAWVMAKLEKPLAMEHLDEIISVSDGIMVARGDLGVELPIEQVPGLQKSITRAARRAGKPVVIATQMLESMVEAASPTRAEISDVATAVFEGADAVMLSAESAIGNYPVEAVSMMDRVAKSVESDPQYRSIIERDGTRPETTSADAITLAARQVAETIGAAAIICYTNSGSTGLRASRERPKVPIMVLTPSQDTARRMALAWGVHCVVTDDVHSFQEMVEHATVIAKNECFAKFDNQVIITAGVPFGSPGNTNVLRIATIGSKYQ